MSRKLVYRSGEHKRERIDRYLKENLDISRERLKKLLKAGNILVDNRIVPPSYLLQNNDQIGINSLNASFPDGSLVKPECGQIDIIYEDQNIIVVNKPAGILTHPTSRVLTGTLVNFLLYHTKLSSTGLPFRPGVVHRLDKETSGVIVFAKTDSSFDSLVRQFQNRQIEKEYIAVVQGRFQPSKKRVEFTVLPDKDDHTKMDVHYLRGKKAITILEVVKYIDNLTVVKAKPVTGRTHQIRITLAHLGYPIIGDLKYGVKSDMIDRVALHSYRLTLTIPSTGEKKSFIASIPEDLNFILPFPS